MPSDRTPPSYTRVQRRLLTALAGLVVAALAGAAYVLTYDVLRELALAGRASRRWAPLYPAMADALVAMTLLSLVVTRGARWWTRLLRWTLLLVLVAGGAAASVQHSVRGYDALPDDAVRTGVAVAPHVMLVIAVWLWLTMFRQIRVARPAAEESAPADAQRGHVKVLEPAAPPLALEAAPEPHAPVEADERDELIPFPPAPSTDPEPTSDWPTAPTSTPAPTATEPVAQQLPAEPTDHGTNTPWPAVQDPAPAEPAPQPAEREPDAQRPAVQDPTPAEPVAQRQSDEREANTRGADREPDAAEGVMGPEAVEVEEVPSEVGEDAGGVASEPPPLDALPAPRRPAEAVPVLLPTDVELVRGREREGAEPRPVASTTRPDIVLPPPPGEDEDLHDAPTADRAEDPDAGDDPARDLNPPPSSSFRSGPTPPAD